MRADKMKAIRIAYLLFFDKKSAVINLIFAKKKAIIGSWKSNPIEKQLHRINEVIELIEKIISSFPANDIKNLKLIGINIA